MARSLHKAKLFSALVVDGFSHAITRRAFSSATQGVASTTKRGGAAAVSDAVAKKSGEEAVRKAEKASWVPDPKTGYYKPENTKVIDPAELRNMLLTKKNSKTTETFKILCHTRTAPKNY